MVQLSGEKRDAAPPGGVPKPVASQANLAAGGLEQHGLMETGPAAPGANIGDGLKLIKD